MEQNLESQAIARQPVIQPTVSHWSKHAQQWNQIGAPLRPDASDIACLEHQLQSWCKASHSPFEVLLLGVTPEIASLTWPPQTHLLALDRAPEMIEHVWPQHLVPIGSQAICGDWDKIPLPSATCDWVVGDGCFTLLAYPDGYGAVLQDVQRVLKPEGFFSMRFFLRPAVTETVDSVFKDLWMGKIGNFHIFKWRLAMALHGTLEQGVNLANLWEVWHQHVPQPTLLAQRLSWSIETVRTIDAYRNISTNYTFPTLQEVRSIFAPYFRELECYFPDYELGDRCPTLLFQSLA